MPSRAIARALLPPKAAAHLEPETQCCCVPGVLLLIEPVAPEGFTVGRQLCLESNAPVHFKQVDILQL